MPKERIINSHLARRREMQAEILADRPPFVYPELERRRARQAGIAAQLLVTHLGSDSVEFPDNRAEELGTTHSKQLTQASVPAEDLGPQADALDLTTIVTNHPDFD